MEFLDIGMFQILNREFSFEVDLSIVGCGLNAVFFFTATPEDGGKEKYGFAGAAYGTGYCVTDSLQFLTDQLAMSLI